MIIEYCLLILGFVILLTSGDLLVRAGVSIAGHLKISPLVSGITVVALGTSAPEFFVSLGAALKGSPDIAMGNVVGSNISNVALVLGVTAVILPLPVIKKTIRFDWVVMMVSSLLLLLFSYTNNQIDFWEGIVMVGVLVWYLTHSIYHSRKAMKSHGEISQVKYSWGTSIVLILVASAGLYYGADLLVENAKTISLAFGVSERVVGITIIALGTSLPELATSVIAACKKELDISVGNIVGSNIFNLLGVLGATSILKKITVDIAILNFDIHIMILISVALLALLMIPKKYVLQRWNGGVLFFSYVSYVVWVFIA